jgi:fused signal recognition particle receptor
MSWFKKLSDGLRKTTDAIGEVFTKRKLDAATLEELEDLLIMADMGAHTAAAVVAELALGRVDSDIGEDEIKQLLAASIAKRLAPYAVPLFSSSPPEGERDVPLHIRGGRDALGLPPTGALEKRADSPSGGELKKPFVVLVVGVNGNGKTTTIGKMAHQMMGAGKKVMLVAADTFRAAAVEQLERWSDNAGCAFVRGADNADPASVAYAGLEKAIAEGVDVVFIDTAGRLHTKDNLMAELGKITKVLGKLLPDAPHAVIQVLDATTGQNALAQVKAFGEVAKLTGLVVTKLDGTAKAGIVVALAEQFKLPIHAIGVGEGPDDLQPFAADDFARALVGLD